MTPQPIAQNAFVVSFAFPDYTVVRSGMPKVVMAHQQMHNRAGISYVYLFSLKKNMLDDRLTLFCEYGVVVDGEFCGVYAVDEVIGWLAGLVGEGRRMLGFHVHHLMYTHLGRLQALLSLFPDAPVTFFVHDHHWCCAGFNLLRDGCFCGARPLSYAKCAGCRSYAKGRRLEAALDELLAFLGERARFVAPSTSTAGILLAFRPELAGRVDVIPHQLPEGHYRENLEPLAEDEPLRVAYLGSQSRHKGWELWRQAVGLAPQGAYRFVVFNNANDGLEGMERVPVSYSPEHPDAMTCALRAQGVHVVFLCSICPETFSFTCMEAAAANAFIVTCAGSGNIADYVREHACGRVLDSPEEAAAYITLPKVLRADVNAFRARMSGGPLRWKDNDANVAWPNGAGAPGNAVALPVKRAGSPIDAPLARALSPWYSRQRERRLA